MFQTKVFNMCKLHRKTRIPHIKDGCFKRTLTRYWVNKREGHNARVGKKQIANAEKISVALITACASSQLYAFVLCKRIN